MNSKAANVSFPTGAGGSSNSDVMYIAVTTTHAVIDVTAFAGKFVEMVNESTTTTDYAAYFYSANAAAEVDRTIASSASGARDPKLGAKIYGTQFKQGRVPYLGPNTKVYLIVEGSAALNLRLDLVEK
jgi:hypothetical protein